jgi:hypothetical protein
LEKQNNNTGEKTAKEYLVIQEISPLPRYKMSRRKLKLQKEKTATLPIKKSIIRKSPYVWIQALMDRIECMEMKELQKENANKVMI